MNNRYAIITNEKDGLHCITIEATELYHIALIAKGLVSRGSKLQAIAIQENDNWREIA